MISIYCEQDISIWQKKWLCEKTNKQKFREKGSLTAAILEELVFPDATAYTKECFLRNFVFI